MYRIKGSFNTSYGGRTNASKLFYECQGEEMVLYLDFTSLYPFCNKTTPAVVGHPQIITENFQDLSTYFSLIKCTVLPPRGPFYPVLPYRTQGKLIFPLCKTCADTCNQAMCTQTDEERAIQGTWVRAELGKAFQKGYIGSCAFMRCGTLKNSRASYLKIMWIHF